MTQRTFHPNSSPSLSKAVPAADENDETIRSDSALRLADDSGSRAVKLMEMYWEEGYLGNFTPCWKQEPSIVAIEKLFSRIMKVETEACLLAEGDLNKIYSFRKRSCAAKGEDERCPADACLLRVSMPIYPYVKTESEAATLFFAREVLPGVIPEVIAYSSEASADEIGCEWLLFSRMEGEELCSARANLTEDQERNLASELADIQAALYQRKLRGIGSLHFTCSTKKEVAVGQVASLPFCWKGVVDPPKEPFKTSYDYLSALVNLRIKEFQPMLAADNRHEAETARRYLVVLGTLLDVLPKFFPPEQPAQSEETSLLHHDLHDSNLLIDPSKTVGLIKALLDWECIVALPSWAVCRFPKLISGGHCNTLPVRSDYTDIEEWQHEMTEYKNTRARGYFLDRMRVICPEWVQVYESSGLKRDFLQATAVNELNRGQIYRWLQALQLGEMRRLEDFYDGF